MKTLAIVFAVLLLTGCGREELPDPNLPIDQYVQAISKSIESVEVNKLLYDQHGQPISKPSYYVTAVLKFDFFWGDAQDWNGLASKVSYIARPAFERPELARLRFKVVDKSGADWAYVDLRRYKFPAGWKDLSYLEQFAVLDVDGGYIQSNQALCEFYHKYESAQPKGWKGCQP